MNYSEEQIKKALRVFIDDPQTAQKFAEAMRKGLELAEMESEAHPFEEDEEALKELNAEVADLMELQGFSEWGRGGGTTAWGRYLFGGNDSAAPYMTVSFSENGGAYFSELAEAHAHANSIMVCFYDAAGDWVNSDMPIYYSWEQFKNNFKGGY